MSEKKRFSTFLVGFLLSGLVWLLFWYWQKSTSAEDGALDMLDRLAAAEARMKTAQARLAEFQAQQVTTGTATVAPAIPVIVPDELERIKGIGPVFASRLQAANIITFASVAAQTADSLAELLDIGPARAASIIAEAKKIV